jgi:hypothetical protein
VSYVIQALVARPETLARAELPGARIVALPQNLALIPLKGIVRRPLRLTERPLTDEPVKPLSEELVALLVRLSARARVVYLEAGFYGGAGLQASVLAEQGQLDEPVISRSAINEALEYFDVDTAGAVDAFDALGLGRFRHTEDW